MATTRKRISIGTTLALSFALFAFTGGVAQAATLVVNTTTDAPVEQGPGSAAATMNACLDTGGNGETVGGPAGGIIATTLNSQAGQVPQKCSLRMALAFAPVVDSNNDLLIKFALNPGATLSVESPLPPVVNLVTGSVGKTRRLTIDGCGDSKASADRATDPGPCVNLEFPPDPNLQLGSLTPLSLLPDWAPGLTVLGDEVTVSGIAFQVKKAGSNPSSDGPAIWVPPQSPLADTKDELIDNFRLENSYFGLKVTHSVAKWGAGEAVASRIGVLISGRNAAIGIRDDAKKKEKGSYRKDDTSLDAYRKKRNVFAGAGSEGEGVGVVLAGATSSQVNGNWFGVDHEGNPTGDLGMGVVVAGLRAHKGQLLRMLKEELDEAALGLSLVAERVDDPTPGTQPENAPGVERAWQGMNNSIGGSLLPAHAGLDKCEGLCNVFADVGQVAIDVGGGPVTSELLGSCIGLCLLDEGKEIPSPLGTSIVANRIGVDGTGQAAGNGGRNDIVDDELQGGIVVQNGAEKTVIGSDSASATRNESATHGNVISNNKKNGVAVHTSAWEGTVIAQNVGSANTTGEFIDLDAANLEGSSGNRPTGPSGGVQDPKITSVAHNSVSGTATGNARVHVYVASEGAGKRGQIASYVGQATASGGTWSVSFPSGSLTGQRLTATQDKGEGTSELSVNSATVPSPPLPPDPPKDDSPVQVPKQAPPPPEPPKLGTVLGRDRDGGTVRLHNVPSRLSGRMTSAVGVRRVTLALELLPKKKARKRSRLAAVEALAAGAQVLAERTGVVAQSKRRCSFLHLQRGKYMRRLCTKPPFTRARGGTTWRLNLSKKTRKRIKRGRDYLLHVRATDALGRVTVDRVPFQVRAARKRKK